MNEFLGVFLYLKYNIKDMDMQQLAEVLLFNFTFTQCEDNVHIKNDKVISYLMLNTTRRIEFDSMTLKNAKKNELCIVQ